MNGTPVWLASVSKQGVGTDHFSTRDRAKAKALLLATLEGVGNPKRQRLFRMCVTTCMHRALSDEELGKLPDSFHSAPAIDIAGGPVEILEETEPGSPSTKPCHAPVWTYPVPGLKFPMDCGLCEPCVARQRC